MKSYLSLVAVSARVHKRQSRMTRLCIVLAVFLITTIFSMAEMLARGQQEEMIRKHGNYHIALQGVEEDIAEQIRQRSDVAVFCEYRERNVDRNEGYYLKDKNIVLYGVEETYLADIMNYHKEGSYPVMDHEIALSADAKELFGIKTGDNVTLQTPAGEIDVTVSAFYEDDSEWNSIIDGCCGYLNRSSFQSICNGSGSDAGTKYYLRFYKNADIKNAIADIKEEYGLTAENVDENTAVLSLLGASSNQMMKSLYPLIIACFVLVLLAGVFMISSCMNSTVAQRTSFFGMMRCIGASKEQIVRFVRLEALSWCKSAIPSGCVLGVATCWAACAVLRFVVKGEWADIPLFGVSTSGIISGIAIGIITVFLAAQSPAKQAAKVSPASAVSGNAQAAKKVSHAANTGFFRVETSLGIHHAKSAKKNLFLMTGSFALTIVLFLVFSSCLDIVKRLVPSESNFSPDIAIASEENGNTIDRKLAQELAKIPGVEHAFGTMYALKLPVLINGSERTVDMISYDEYMLETSKKSVASGDLSKVYGDSEYVFSIFSEDGKFNVGDKVMIGEQEMELACVLSEGVGSVSGLPVIVCSEETFLRLMGEQGYMMINMILKKDAGEKVVNQVRSLMGSHEFIDRREEKLTQHGSFWVMRAAAYGFLTIISFITVLNIMNNISMGVSARIKQYGAMRAVGMESGQITRMITAEAVTYAFWGMFVGIVIGLAFHYLIFRTLIVNHFGGRWQIPFSTLAIIAALIVTACIVAVITPAKRIRGMAITETINEL